MPDVVQVPDVVRLNEYVLALREQRTDGFLDPADHV
jgi:hypothetical protein